MRFFLSLFPSPFRDACPARADDCFPEFCFGFDVATLLRCPRTFVVVVFHGSPYRRYTGYIAYIA